MDAHTKLSVTLLVSYVIYVNLELMLHEVTHVIYVANPATALPYCTSLPANITLIICSYYYSRLLAWKSAGA